MDYGDRGVLVKGFVSEVAISLAAK